MAGTRLLMRRLRELLRLKYEHALSHRAIAHACGVGLGTVSGRLERATKAGLTWPLPADLDDAALEARLLVFPIGDGGNPSPCRRRTVNRTGFVGGPIPGEDGLYGTNKSVLT